VPRARYGQGMDIPVRLMALTAMHPHLLWDDIIAATVAVLNAPGTQSPFPFVVTVQNVPGFGSGQLRLTIDSAGIAPEHVSRLRRTYEPSRLVELAAIAELQVTDEFLYLVPQRVPRPETGWGIGGTRPRIWRAVIARETGSPVEIRAEYQRENFTFRLQP
jgi:hypothetical protein